MARPYSSSFKPVLGTTEHLDLLCYSLQDAELFYVLCDTIMHPRYTCRCQELEAHHAWRRHDMDKESSPEAWKTHISWRLSMNFSKAQITQSSCKRPWNCGIKTKFTSAIALPQTQFQRSSFHMSPCFDFQLNLKQDEHHSPQEAFCLIYGSPKLHSKGASWTLKYPYK